MRFLYTFLHSQSSDLVSDLGGQVGLWIGVSVLTLFEFLELVYDIFLLVCGKHKV